MVISPPDWKTVVTDPTERKVFRIMEELEGGRRTAENIAEKTGLGVRVVRKILTRKGNKQLVRRTSIRSDEGHVLYVLKSRPTSFEERLARFRGAHGQ